MKQISALYRKYYEKYKVQVLYLIFGVLTTAINYGAYYVFVHPLGVSIVGGNVLAWVLSVLFAFVTNKLVVFESKSLLWKVVAREFAAFVAARLLSGLLDTGIMFVFAERLRFNDMIVKIASNVLVIIINYVLSKAFIFARKEGAARS